MGWRYLPPEPEKSFIIARYTTLTDDSCARLKPWHSCEKSAHGIANPIGKRLPRHRVEGFWRHREGAGIGFARAQPGADLGKRGGLAGFRQQAQELSHAHLKKRMG